MGLFDFLQKKQPPKANDLKHLTPNGELPWGWHTHTKDFTEKINREFSYYLNAWVETRNKSPEEQCLALRSFIQYLEETEKLCKSKGECFEFWFYQILISKGYIAQRKKELNDLAENPDKSQADFSRRNNLLIGLDDRIKKTLKENPGIFQSDFIKMFDPLVQDDVREKLYFMEKSKKLQRTKSGRSYILHYK